MVQPATQSSERRAENRRQRGQPRSAWIGAAITLLAGLFFLMTPLGDGLRLRSYDLLFRVRPAPKEAALDEVVILSMDEESGRELNQDADRPWDREVHTRLLKELTKRGAGPVVFDVLWDQPSTNRLVDEQLGDAIREHGRVVLAAHWRRLPDLPGLQQVVPPANPLGTNAPWGLVEFPVNPGASEMVRRQFYHPDFPNMPWQAALLLKKVPPDRTLTFWMNYYGPAGTIPPISYHRVFSSNSLARDFFIGKTIFVGKASVITSQGPSLDSFPTPYSLQTGGLTSGVEIEATAFLNLIHTEWLDELGPGLELLLVLLSGIVFGAGLSLVRPWTATALACVGALLLAAGSAWVAWQMHVWFPWLVLCVVEIPCALVCSILAQTRRLAREKETLERDVALAESVARLPQMFTESDSVASPTTPDLAYTPIETPTPEYEPPPIPNHQLLRRIGRGAYGEVWLARDEIGTYHAVKIVYLRSFASAAPYEREFRGIQKFTPISRSHPGFVHVLHVGRNEGCFFYIMELGDDQETGQHIEPQTYSPKTLAKEVEKRKRVPLPECLQLGLDLASALDFLHQRNLIHRDIKPSNIIFVNDAPKFADIGLVTDIKPPGRETTFVGTEGYMAPEGPGAAAGDIFSLGKVLYEIATGCDRHEFPMLPSTLVDEAGTVLRQFNDILLKACAPDPRQRYQNAGELLAALRHSFPNKP